MTEYSIALQQNNNGDLYVHLPDEVQDDLGWKEGDIIEWNMKGLGLTINRINEPFTYEINEE